jgi:hypothetical protein
LFLIYINDLEANIKSKIKLFADDTPLNDPATSAEDLNNDLEVIRTWAYQWKRQFNPDPTKQAVEIIFSCKNKKQNHHPPHFGGKPVVRQNYFYSLLCRVWIKLN